MLRRLILGLAFVFAFAPLSAGTISAASGGIDFSQFRCVDFEPGESYKCEGVGCRLQIVGPSQAFCATSSEFVLHDLQAGEQMCCTANEAVVRSLEAGKCLLCNRLEARVFDKKPETDFAHFPDYCCTADNAAPSQLVVAGDRRTDS